MPKSKHRRKKGKGRRIPRRNAALRARIEKDDRLTAVIVLAVKKCRELFGTEPPEGYSHEQIDMAFRQLQDEGLLPRRF